MIEGYDVDGFELQMNYTPYYFHPSRTAAGAPLMTAFMRDVKALLAAKTAADGRPRELCVRIPPPAFCAAQVLGGPASSSSHLALKPALEFCKPVCKPALELV